MMTIDEIERLAAGQPRIDAYRRYLEAKPNHPVAWFNFAVELERATQYHEARRAVSRLRNLNPELYIVLPRRLRELAGDLDAPQRIDREVGGYRITEIGAASESHILYGGMCTSDGQAVTLRRILDLSQDGARTRFEAELAGPRADGVARASAIVDDSDGAPLLVLEHLRGDTLRGETHGAALDAEIAARLIRSAARAIAALHAAGGIHGDLRPDHVIREEPGSEIVRIIGAQPAGADLPVPYGHLLWQTPEEVAGSRAMPASDVYGLGLLLWHLVTGREPPPIEQRTPLPRVTPQWPELDDLICRTSAREPRDRPTAAELLRALDDVITRRVLPPVIGKWRIREQIGEDPWSRVFDAENVDVAGVTAAVKVLTSTTSRDRVRRFLDEASAASRIDHPGIVRIVDGGIIEGGICYVALEKLSGRDLRRELVVGKLAVARVVQLGRQAASALAAAHAAGIVHGEIQPSNLFVVRHPGGEGIKLLGFGTARLDDPSSAAASADDRWAYRAPEQWQGARDLDGRTDIYSLGVVLWQCLAGRLPFRVTTPSEWRQAHLTAPVPELTQLVPHVPPRLAALVSAMTAKRREDRPAAMIAIEAEFAAIAGEEAKRIQPPPPIQPSVPIQPMAPIQPPVPLPAVAVEHPQPIIQPVVPRHPPDLAPPQISWRKLGTWAVGLCVAIIAAVSLLHDNGGGDGGGSGGSDSTGSSRGSEGSAHEPGVQQVNPPVSGCPEGMVAVPAGTFRMGSPSGVGDPDEAQHTVTLPTYCLDKTEVTMGQYATCVKAGGCSDPPLTVNQGRLSETEALRESALCTQRDQLGYPINCIDWSQATAYCAWAGRRLPTEAEWEYAARGTDERMYPWGNDAPDPTRLNACGPECFAVHHSADPAPMYTTEDEWETTAPVGSVPGDVGTFGVLDMAGNVSEWTADLYGSYSGANTTSVRGAASEQTRVVRGGSWFSTRANRVRAAYRNWEKPVARRNTVGFRCAR